jgi:hypothetical protein
MGRLLGKTALGSLGADVGQIFWFLLQHSGFIPTMYYNLLLLLLKTSGINETFCSEELQGHVTNEGKHRFDEKNICSALSGRV